MWWRLIVLVLSIAVILLLLFFIIISIIIQQFDDVNALNSPIFFRSSRKNLKILWWIILLRFENQLICISKIAAMG